MRRVLPGFMLLAIVLSPSASPAEPSQVLRAGGLAVVAPTSWHLTRERLTECSSPMQVMALTDTKGRLGLGAKIPRDPTLVLLLEDRMYQGGNFPPRRRFRLQPLGLMGGCCDMPFSRGFQILFRDHGRNLYAFVYTAKRQNATRAVAMLNTLEVR
ncbi:MAG TPA: hypothetical protein VF063_05995 [Gaiellaceae bacterium]